MAEHVHPGQIPLTVNARAITRERLVKHPSQQTIVTRLRVEMVPPVFHMTLAISAIVHQAFRETSVRFL